MSQSVCPSPAASLHDVLLNAMPPTRLLFTEEQPDQGIRVVICLPERLPRETEVSALVACIGVRLGCPETLVCLFQEPIPGYDEVIIREAQDAPPLDDAALDAVIKTALLAFDNAFQMALAEEAA